MSFAGCQGLQAAKPQAAVAGPRLFPTPCRLDLLWHKAGAAPAPRRSLGAQVARKGDIKRMPGKTPVWRRREGAFDEVSPNMQLILT